MTNMIPLENFKVNGFLKREKLSKKMFWAHFSENPENSKITPSHHFEVGFTIKVGSRAPLTAQESRLSPFDI